jgi:hypothetical protein
VQALVELPDTYKEEILEELKKPEAQQEVTEGFFIEMERSLTTVQRAMPEAIRQLNSEVMSMASVNKSKKGASRLSLKAPVVAGARFELTFGQTGACAGPENASPTFR